MSYTVLTKLFLNTEGKYLHFGTSWMFKYDTDNSQFFKQSYVIIFSSMLFLAEEQKGKPGKLQTQCSFEKQGALYVKVFWG